MAFLFFFLIWVGLGAFFVRRSNRISGWLAMIGDSRNIPDPKIFWVAYFTCLLSGPFQSLSLHTAPAVTAAYHKIFGKR